MVSTVLPLNLKSQKADIRVLITSWLTANAFSMFPNRQRQIQIVSATAARVRARASSANVADVIVWPIVFSYACLGRSSASAAAFCLSSSATPLALAFLACARSTFGEDGADHAKRVATRGDGDESGATDFHKSACNSARQADLDRPLVRVCDGVGDRVCRVGDRCCGSSACAAFAQELGNDTSPALP